MKCYCCDVETDFVDRATDRNYCSTCWNIITKTAYSEGFTIDEEDDTMLVQGVLQEAGIHVRDTNS